MLYMIAIYIPIYLAYRTISLRAILFPLHSEMPSRTALLNRLYFTMIKSSNSLESY